MTSSGTDGTGVVLTREQVIVLESIFWLALGCVLGRQEKECYEGANPLTFEPINGTPHKSSRACGTKAWSKS